MKQLGNNLPVSFPFGEQGSCSTVLAPHLDGILAEPRKSPLVADNLVDGGIVREGRFFHESPGGL